MAQPNHTQALADLSHELGKHIRALEAEKRITFKRLTRYLAQQMEDNGYHYVSNEMQTRLHNTSEALRDLNKELHRAHKLRSNLDGIYIGDPVSVADWL